ncbi:C-type lectin domain family 10 member A-like [Archocentrus centrarchus]|uniref:C-type lectin domain family 10 member A-like n=1 Tax=Archocentrus centrarchus TaxID=63155 RepID=UPI0011EA2321|nr:C-type lectin domain family 10 member A-like [Archocentrus centrarchus]
MSRPQGYIEGEVFDSRRVKSNRWTKLSAEKLALMALCLLLASALVVTYLLFELLKMREMLRNLEVQLETVKSEVTEQLPEIQPCPTVQHTCPPHPEVKMITKPCSTIQPTTPQPPEVTNDPCNKCEAGWEHHGGKCYHFSISKSSWNRSRAYCRAEGGDLVKIDSREEQRFLTITMKRNYFWIGLTDSAEEGNWMWVDGSPLNESLTFWFVHEPDDWTNEDPDGEDCARTSPIYWFDKSCKAPQRSICEKPAVALCA